MNLINLKATKNDEGRSLYKYLSKSLNNAPKSAIEKLFRLKNIKVNNKKTGDKTYLLKEGDNIFVYGISNSTKNSVYNETQINFLIIYEDENILVINKPAGVSMHGFFDSIDNQVLTYLKYKQIDSFRPSSIGRLDKSTSGIVVYAKTYKALVQLNKKINKYEKYYLLKSDFPWERKLVILYAKKNKNTYKLDVSDIYDKSAKKIETLFFKDQNKKYAKITTGKKHQIRVTLQYLGYPIYGDRKYGGKLDKRVYLHSYKIVFHNLDGELEYLNNTQFICNIKW